MEDNNSEKLYFRARWLSAAIFAVNGAISAYGYAHAPIGFVENSTFSSHKHFTPEYFFFSLPVAAGSALLLQLFFKPLDDSKISGFLGDVGCQAALLAGTIGLVFKALS